MNLGQCFSADVGVDDREVLERLDSGGGVQGLIADRAASHVQALQLRRLVREQLAQFCVGRLAKVKR